MFCVTLKMKSVKTVLIICAFTLLILVAVAGSGAITTSTEKKEVHASTEEGRIQFLEEYGWKTSGKSVEMKEVIIPSEFNSTYKNYNDLQKKQGMDLSKLAGCQVEKWTYEIMNYGDEENRVLATILVNDGKVVGGDISAVKEDGFMHGFQKPMEPAAATNDQLKGS